jgi:hypothetical protein
MTDQELSFDESDANVGPTTCARCSKQLTEYWAVDGEVLCEACKDEVLAAANPADGGVGRFLRAILYGTGGMLAGAAVWAAVEFYSGWTWSLIAVLIGFLVGKGVHIASGNRGGIRYQILALALTWVGYGLASTPSLIREIINTPSEVVDSLSAAGNAPADSLGAAASSAVSDSLAPIAEISDSALDAELAALDSSLAKGGTVAKEGEAAPAFSTWAILGVVAGMILALPALAVFSGGSFLLAIIYLFGLYQAWSTAGAVRRSVSGPHPVGAPA